MTQQVQTTCDCCAKDITRGVGRMWRMDLSMVTIGLAAGTTPRHDVGAILPVLHFCDEHCLAAWATKAAADKDTAEAAYVVKQAQRKAEEEAKALAKPQPETTAKDATA